MRFRPLVALLPLVLSGLNARAQRATSATIRVDGIPFHYSREGRGPTLALIGSATYYPKAYSTTLRRQFDLIFIDSRHFVPSYQPNAAQLESLTVETFADDLEAIRQQLRIERWAVVGHSIHAQIAIAYARKYPQHTSHLIIIGGVPYAFSEFAAAADSFWAADASPERKAILASNTQHLDSLLAAGPPSRAFAIRYRARGPLYWADPSYDATTLLEGLENGPALGRLAAALPTRAAVRTALEEIKAPTLIILGRFDYAVPYFVWAPLIAGLPRVTLVVLERDGHNPQTEHPERFDPVLIDWIGKH